MPDNTETQNLVDTGKISAQKIKEVSDLALANVSDDAHLVSTLFRIHKRAKPANKLWSLYVIDAISRDFRSAVKKGKGKEAGKGSPASFLQKMEVCLERIVDESWQNGLPEHKVSSSLRLPYCESV